MTVERIENIGQQEPFQPRRTILLPVDDSHQSEQTLSWALSKIATPQDLIILINVRPQLEPQQISDSRFENLKRLPSQRRKAHLKEKSYHILRSHIVKIIKKGYNYKAIALVGNTGEQLEYEIRMLKPNLIIMGNRGAGTFKSFLLGSVSNHLAHHCEFPLLICPPFEQEIV